MLSGKYLCRSHKRCLIVICSSKEKRIHSYYSFSAAYITLKKDEAVPAPSATPTCPPTATYVAPTSVDEGDTDPLLPTYPVDSAGDVATVFDYRFDCGDGSGYDA